MEIDPSHTREDLIRFVDDANRKLWLTRGIPGFDHDKLVTEALHKAREADYPFGIAQCTLNTGMGAYVLKHDVPLSTRLLDEALTLFNSCGNQKWIANTHCITGIISNSKGDTDTALYHALRGIDYYEDHPGEEADATMAYYVIGTIYKDLKKTDEAEKFYLRGIERPDKNKKTWGGRIYSGLANIYTDTGNYEKALEYSFKAISILEEEQNAIAVSRAFTDTGMIYKKLKDYSLALEYLEKGLKIRLEKDLKAFLYSSHIEIAALFVETGEWQKAIAQLEKAGQIALATQQLQRLANIYEQFMVVYKNLNEYIKAFSYAEKLLLVNADIHKKENEIKISSLRDSLFKEKEEEIERLKNVELKKAYELIGQKNKDITDSLHYAKRIQQSILPSEGYIGRNMARLKR